ncbi:DUF5302 domain-containing protein [Pseudactinotalea sp. Z1732]|uniref:DUF5302 domain-containing protein n=1 Tax=Micrococcales TaxID=85006 RepID=UPI003C7B041B
MSSKKNGSEGPDRLMADAKAKMREALDRKNAGDHPTADGVRNTGSVNGPEVVGEPKRTFRPRKTG